MEKLQIEHRYTGAVLFEYQPVASQEIGMAVSHTLEAAVKGGGNQRART